MKYVLAILCGLLVLFMGGCAVMALAAGPLALIPGGLAALNVMIILAIFQAKRQFLPAFYVLGIIDLLVAVAAAVAAPSMGTDGALFWLAAALFAVKGVLSLIFARSLRTSS